MRRLVLVLAACSSLAACGGTSNPTGGSTNPTVSSSDFLTYCHTQPQYSQASVDCRCVQQKLEAAGYGGKHVSDPSFKEAPATLIDPCVGAGQVGQGTPSTTT